MSVSASSWLDRLIAATAGYVGSTRPIALIRIAVPLLAWAEYGFELVMFRDPRWTIRLIALSMFASTLMLLVGWMTRVAAIWAALSLTLLFLVVGDYYGREYFVHHHSYMLLLSTWLLALSPCGKSYSVDRWLAVRRARRLGQRIPLERAPLWAQRLICVHVSTVYFWSAFDKCNPAFLSGARIEHFFMSFYNGSDYPEIPGFHIITLALAWGTVALEFFLAIGLWLRRTRRIAMLAGVIFHLTLYLALPVATFSIMTMVMYLAFLDPDAVHRVIDELEGVVVAEHR
jgi:uncharacterized membrane protein YphA (DoxX/SURF4 family)